VGDVFFTGTCAGKVTSALLDEPRQEPPPRDNSVPPLRQVLGLEARPKR